MAGLCEGGNEPPGSLKAIRKKLTSVRVSKQFTFLPLLALPYVSSEHPSFTTIQNNRNAAANSSNRRLHPNSDFNATRRHKWRLDQEACSILRRIDCVILLSDDPNHYLLLVYILESVLAKSISALLLTALPEEIPTPPFSLR
ncbi:hypothetical protein ANN_21843 [Periplaneta americana]|uniref:Uncharacterized protein n=1 Tax=Periplaneta americana TaxID=6978 RepID=A0ABQ8S6H9_PERAM|nr:hypothetical protein ANN_21843 [Periplaneta americana]